MSTIDDIVCFIGEYKWFMPNPYEAAINQAREELGGIKPAIQSLLVRQELLEGVIASLQKMIQSTEYPLKQFVSPPGLDDGETPAYLWQQIREVMKGESAWSLSEAGTNVERALNINLEPNRPQKIRNSVIRHPEVFERLPDGRYLVR